jgi:hypothetical protein
MRKIRNPIQAVSLSALEDARQRDATAAAIAAARGVIQMDGPIPPGTPVGRLSETEWGWVVAGVLFAWISKRAEQAAADKLDTEELVRLTAMDPPPWDGGAVAAILPDLVDACPDLDWSKPLSAWSREDMVEFLLKATMLVRKAMTARDMSDKGITQQASAATIARRANAGAGGSLMVPDEFNDAIRTT